MNDLNKNPHKNLTVLYITNQRLEKDGGGSGHFREIAHELPGYNKKVVVLGPKYDNTDLTQWKPKLHLVPLPGRNFFSFLLYESTLWLVMLICIFRYRVDIVLDRGTYSGPKLYFICKLLGKKYLREVNGVVDHEWTARKNHPAIVRFFYNSYFSLVYRCANYYICVAPGIREELSRRWQPFQYRSIVIANGVNEKQFTVKNQTECRKQVDLPVDKFIFGFVGQLNVWHGVEDLIKASKVLMDRGHTNFEVIIVGGHPERVKELIEKCNSLGLNSYVKLLGMINRKIVPLYNSSFNMACQVHNDPIIGRMGNSLKFWEYLAAGIPVLVSDMSEASDWVSPGKVGFVFEGGNIQSMADKMEYALKNPEECSEIGEANRQFIETEHRWKDVARRVSETLDFSYSGQTGTLKLK